MTVGEESRSLGGFRARPSAHNHHSPDFVPPLATGRPKNEPRSELNSKPESDTVEGTRSALGRSAQTSGLPLEGAFLLKRLFLLLVAALALFVPAVGQAASGPAMKAEAATCHGERATIVGTPGRDHIIGTGGKDVIKTFGRPDIIRARGGNDVICAGPGGDRIDDGSGDDRVFAQRGEDFLTRAPGNDWVRMGRGVDLIEDARGDDTYYGGRGYDTVGLDVDGDDAFFGGAGFDAISFAWNQPITDSIQVDLAAGTAVTSAGADTLRSVERADGSAGNDLLIGNAVRNVLVGDEGDDDLRGAAGNDSLYGGDGVDSLDGGDGTDECFFGETVSTCEEIITRVSL